MAEILVMRRTTTAVGPRVAREIAALLPAVAAVTLAINLQMHDAWF